MRGQWKASWWLRNHTCMPLLRPQNVFKGASRELLPLVPLEAFMSVLQMPYFHRKNEMSLCDCCRICPVFGIRAMADVRAK